MFEFRQMWVTIASACLFYSGLYYPNMITVPTPFYINTLTASCLNKGHFIVLINS